MTDKPYNDIVTSAKQMKEVRAVWNDATMEMTEAELKKVAYEFADACVAKALKRLREHPDRSRAPHREYDTEFHKMRLQEEFKEWLIKSDDVSELEDIGNFAAWLFYRLKALPPSERKRGRA
jgi:hypothetical protein